MYEEIDLLLWVYGDERRGGVMKCSMVGGGMWWREVGRTERQDPPSDAL